ncbi:MAG: heavy metal translocating P-type ATPase [Oscillospiraceae bacterium]
MKEKFTVTGMTCTACSAHVEKAVCKLEGVQRANVNLMGGTMLVEHDAALTDAAIVAAVTAAGYGASPVLQTAQNGKASAGTAAPSLTDELVSMKRRLVLSFCFLIPLFYISMGHMLGAPLPHFFHGTENALTFAMAQFLLVLPILYVNDKYYKVGFKTLFHGAPNMDSLIALGSAAAVLYGIVAIFQIGYGLGHGDLPRVARYSMDLYFESAGMILTLITLGKFLETRSKGKTSEAISRLIDLAPKTAIVLRDGVELEIDAADVLVGDLLRLKPGAAAPVDGQVVEGFSSMDESALTGESMPVEKAAGDRVIAASVNGSGALMIKALRVGSDTTLSQMIALVEEASSSKAPISKLADRVAGVFVPVVIGIAIVTAAVWLIAGYSPEFALTSAVAVLVISCPCALGLATPVAVMVGTGKGAENGILVKSAEALETLHTIHTVVLDKTGTVTEGKPVVTDICPAENVTKAALLQLAASLEAPSEHPLASAIVAAAKAQNLDLLTAENFQATHGRGITARLENAQYLAGNRAMLEEAGVPLGEFSDTADRLAAEGKTPLYFAKEGALLGVIAVADTVKASSITAIEGFRSLGIEVVLLTGDNRRTAAAIGTSLGIANVIAEVLPADKERQIAALQKAGKKVAMIGDGINDAPALARADVGIAIGAGADVAIESADVVLMKSDLNDAVTAIRLSKAVIRNIRQNLFWAFVYNIIGIPLAAGVFFPLFQIQLNPMFAAAAMSLSSVCVVSNALRLRFFKPQPTAVTPPNQISKKEVEQIMERHIIIEGMSCQHCSGRVEKALNAIPGVCASVDLAAKTATVHGDAPEDTLRSAITEAGYEVVSIR